MEESGKLQDLFDRAVEMPPSARDAFLAAECVDAELLREVKALLAADAEAAQNPSWSMGAMEIEAAHSAVLGDEHLGETLGAYRIESVIGSGGMGKVYRASRADAEFQQSVAIKLIRGGVEAGEIGLRFRRERQILANLQHPNIARLLDGGTTSQGLPYLVMEYIEGEPLDQWCAHHAPSLEVRLGIFRQVCAAVHYAHQHMVIHRDLKPGNILVTADGTPKLLDFGIAKLLEGGEEQPAATLAGFPLMTPRYASPEQVRGEIVTTSSDVYSLGVVLYELLAGRSPYANPSGPTHEVMQAVREEEPPKPSTAAPELRGDLENIVSMALRKDAARRYNSVDQFAEDIRRCQEGYPVIARPDTRRYRALKFVRRNKTSLVAAVMVLLALVGGIVATAWESRVANQRFNDVRKLANSYLFEFHDAIKDLPGSTAARQLVVKRALEYLDRLAAERGNDAQLGRELATAYMKIGSIQGRPTGASLGEASASIVSIRKAVAILDPLAAAYPRDAGIAHDLAEACQWLANGMVVLGDLNGAVQFNRKAIALMEKFVAAHPTDTKLRETLAVSYLGLGDVTGNRNYQNLGDPKAALELYHKGLAIRQKLVDENPSLSNLSWLSIAYARIAQILESLNDPQGGLAAMRRCLEINDKVLAAEPLNTSARWDNAVGHGNIALTLVRANLTDEAQVHADRDLSLLKEMVDADPKNVPARSALWDAYGIQGRIQEKRGDLAAALRWYRQSAESFESLVGPQGTPPAGQRNAYVLVAEASLKTGDMARALEFARKGLAIDEQLLRVNPKNVNALRNQARANREIGQVHEAAGMRQPKGSAPRTAELREALALYQRSVDSLQALQQAGTLVPAAVVDLNLARERLDQCQKALAK